MTQNGGETWLGFDLSTQKLKAVQLDNRLEVLAQAEVKFDADLPEFETIGGVNAGKNQNEFYVQPIMWVKALDMVLDRLVVQNANLSTVAAISGSAQQHGSLFWSRDGIERLRHLDSDKFLHTQIDNDAFTVHETPIWMDGSTTRQCAEMEAAVGGAERMAIITGSKCFERFTGPQIRKMYQTRTQCYENTERISLVSSFVASLFLGHIAPIDLSDGSGMNLLNIRSRRWSDECLDACAPDLARRLGEPVPTSSIIGTIGQFFVQRYGFNAACKVVAFTGDNPSALAGMIIGNNWLAMSLGTSDTLMMSLKEPPHLREGHVLIHPTEANYMGLLCFRNGSLVRDTFKRAEANNSWRFFGELLESTPRGNSGNMALHFATKEIIPNLQGTLRWSKTSTNCKSSVVKFGTPQTEIRALIEGQVINRKAVASDMGFSFGEDTRILSTGGASVNKSILQVIADVFNAPVYTQRTSEAALFGAAYRAKYVFYVHNAPNEDIVPYHLYIGGAQLPHNMQRICDPHSEDCGMYEEMLLRYRDMVSAMSER